MRLAAALGLVEDELFSNSLSAVVQVMNRFFLERMSSDYKQILPQSTTFENVSSSPSLLRLVLAKLRRPSPLRASTAFDVSIVTRKPDGPEELLSTT